MKLLTALAIALMVALIGTVGFAYSGLYDVSASSPHSGFVNWLLSTTAHASIERRADGVDVPNLDDEALVRAGVNDYSSMCAGCHGDPGQQPGAMGQGLNPPPPDLTESAVHMTAAELFWVTKHGIKMTGMPAWGITHEDEALWPVVAFMTTLPQLDATGYQELLASAEGVGHHAPDEGDSHPHGEAENAPSPHDHGEHQTAGHEEAPASDTGSHDHGTNDHDTPAPEIDKEAHNDDHDHSH